MDIGIAWRREAELGRAIKAFCDVCRFRSATAIEYDEPE